MEENQDDAQSSRAITLDEFLFVSINSKARAEVIEASVIIERVITSMLAMFLSIDIENSKSFSKTGLSFNMKLNLLADINMIDKDEKAKLIKFSEIRNIFAHESKTHMFFQCFDQIGLRTFLIKCYGEQKSTYNFQEENDRLLFYKLYENVKEICKGLFGKMMFKAEESGRTKGTIDFFFSLRDVLGKMSEADADFCARIDSAYEEAKRNLKNSEDK